MATLVIIYDSKTGNTEKMAKSVAEGAKSVSGVDTILKKIGEPFSLRILNDADAIILGAPAHYSHVTPEMRDFLASLIDEKEAGRIKFQGKLGAAFGSYGWDGGVAIERLARNMEKLGLKVYSPVLTKAPLLPYPSLKDKDVKKCQDLGKSLAEEILKKD